ncbi:hypothetical protein CLM62_12875 [Streptomyces sp. SA15]|uniref:hypothetical protein n=1 Tax=Streptomyces sp. SA15 TaxID=934019 RepID=UPI000BB00AB0|nr:hypothetical protein [Streptomyces sp. SA15]PAZ15684.1 hypothetical protein CLM62_12875 [Streptomyces sp. SA15]
MTRDVRILNTGSLLELQRRLRAAGGENIRSSMQRRIRRAAEPLRDDLQSTMRGLNIRSQGRGTGKRGGPSPTTRPLRATIADAIRISVRTGGNPGATVWVDKGRLPPDLKNMPKVINEGRIRHPVFGNRRRWTNQYASPPWWDTTVRRHTPRMEREVARVLDDVRRRLE